MLSISCRAGVRNDDWSYTQTAFDLTATGRFVYNVSTDFPPANYGCWMPPYQRQMLIQKSPAAGASGNPR